MNASGDELTPPKLAAMPVPFPLWSSTAAARTKQSTISRLSRSF
jgi:hypothetical protein